jgi:hypothetical protein
VSVTPRSAHVRSFTTCPAHNTGRDGCFHSTAERQAVEARVLLYCPISTASASCAGQDRGWGSSVSKVSDYRLDDRGSTPGKGKAFFFSSLCVQTGSEARPASYPTGTGGPFPGVNRGRGVTLTTHPHLVPRSGMSSSCSSSLLGACMA